MKVNPSGSRIQGWRTSDYISDKPSGWYELGIDGSEKLLWEYHDPDWVDDGWSDEPEFPFHTGFYRNGKVYGFHREMLYYWLLWGHGTFTLDGEISDYVTYGEELDVQDFSTYVISCAYDSDNDKVYAYTLNSDASGYMFQSINIDTWGFSPINDNVRMEDVCVGFSYNPSDKKFYGITPDSRFVLLDTNTSNLAQVAKYDLQASTALQGMTYSPLDKCFIFVSSTGDGSSTLYTIDPTVNKLELRSELPDAVQYSILITPDKLADPKAPLPVVITSISFPEGALSGKASLKIPTNTFDGSPLAGALLLSTFIDGEKYNETDVQVGADVEIPINDVTEGNRRFSFIVKSGDFESAEIDRTIYVGFDTPKTPQNIQLSDGALTWDAVTEGINGGYIDADALTYNVYLSAEKINPNPITECSYAFDMPDDVYQKYVAQVEAVNHGHASDRGFSNEIKYGDPFPLPFTVQPTMAEIELFEGISNSNYRSWCYSVDADSNSCFECYTYSFSGEEKWSASFFTPAINIPETEKLVEISFEVSTSGYDDYAENIEVGFGSQQTTDAMTTIKQWDDIKGDSWEKFTAWFYPKAGTTFIGFTTYGSETCDMIRLRNISVKVSDRPDSTPATVSELKVVAKPEGELKANVAFRLPSMSVAGAALEGQLTVTIKSSVETKTVSGTPGSLYNVDIATIEGSNEITVYASNESDGLEATAKVFTGIDIPKPLDGIRTSHTEDFKGLHLEWDAPTQGINGGYVNPDNVTYSLCIYDEEEYEWNIVQDLGTSKQFDYIPDIENGMKRAEVAILTQNEKGNSGIVLTTANTAGKPYTLPYIEEFGESIFNSELGSLVMLEKPDDSYTDSWGYVMDASYWVSQLPPDNNGAFVAKDAAGKKSRIILPAFSTKGIDATGIELSLWGGSSAAEIRIYAHAYGMADELVGTFIETEDGWYKKRFHLPSKFMGKEWVELKIEAMFNAEETTAAFGQFKIQTFVSDDIAVYGMDAMHFPYVGSPAEITATIENRGLQAAAVPTVELIVSLNDEKKATMSMTRVDGEGYLPELGKANFKTSWTPDAETVGQVTFLVRVINPDMDMSNNEMSMEVSVGKGNLAAVTDLAAEETASGVVLTWTDPAVETGLEGFENMTPFSYGDHIGDFKTICLDGFGSSYFGNFRFPYDNEEKAWQVISEEEVTEIMQASEIDNSYLNAASGDRFIAAFTPFTIFVGDGLISDRWIISPEIKGGSSFSFMMSSGATGYVEDIEILCSTTGDNPENFEVIETEKILSAEWRKYEYTSPEDATYFAIRYRGNSDTGFFTMIDDIEYEPAEESPALEGYDIYRNGMLIAEAVNAKGTWTDSYKPEETVYYNIKPLVRSNGILTRGFMSNTAYVEHAGVNGSAISNGKIFGIDGFIVVTGYNGLDVEIFTADGKRVGQYSNMSEIERIPVPAGFYIVNVGNKVAKVIVK